MSVDGGGVKFGLIRPFRLLLAAGFWIGLAVPAWAGQPPAGVDEREASRQAEEERRLRQEWADSAPEARLPVPETPGAQLDYPADETPSFLIREVRLEGEESGRFQWVLRALRDVPGRRLGAKGINIALARAQNYLSTHSYPTSRIVAKPQDLNSGILTLTFIPGRVSGMGLAEGSGRFVCLRTAIPVRRGEILNSKKLEQGLENLRRPPSVQADLELRPGENPGESELAFKRMQGRPIRLSLSTDDSGSQYTGRYQGTAALSLDNPLGLSDSFYAYMGQNLEGGKPYGTDNYGLHYSVPIGFNLLTFNTSRHNYHQVVAGYLSDYEYRGVSQNSGLELSRVVHRDAVSKTTLGAGVFLQTSRNYVDDTELEIQRRRMAGWELFVSHRRRILKVSVDGELRFHRGTGALGALPAPEEELDQGTSRPSILTLNLRLTVPFSLGGQRFRYAGSWREQWAFRKLVYRDRISLAGRHSIRGFNGEMTLSADNGFIFRNELSWEIPKVRQELYAAADFGQTANLDGYFPRPSVYWGGAVIDEGGNVHGKEKGVSRNVCHQLFGGATKPGCRQIGETGIDARVVAWPADAI